MIAYYIEYKIDDKTYNANLDAKNLISARNKIARKHKLKDVTKVKLLRQFVIGYF